MEQLLETKKYAGKRPQNERMRKKIDSRSWKNRLNFSGTDELSMKEITEIVDEVRQEMYEHAEQYS
jgi:NTP pyrophosphatase (non-canonical NTP hydrolase)